MQTVDASVIIEDAERAISWDIDQLETREKQMARNAFSLALQEVWESWWWERLMKSEQIAAATMYAAATAFAAGDFCYYPATQKFYQALQATTGNAPATYDSSTGSYVTNYVYWADAVAIPSAGDYSSTGTYVVGNQARNPEDGYVYQLFSLKDGIQVSGAKISGVNATYTAAGLVDGKTSYVSDTGYQLQWIGVLGLGWAVTDIAQNILYASVSNVDSPLDATNWFSTDNSAVPNHTNDPAPTSFEAVQFVPTVGEAGYWAKLSPFIPSITTNGKVRAVADTDPRNSMSPGLYEFEETLDGIRIPLWTSGVPWIWQRRPTPIITGDDFDSAIIYDPVDPANIVFS